MNNTIAFSLLNEINILFFFVGIAIALYFYIVFSPITSKYFVNLDVKYVYISKINVLHLSMIFILPHILIFTLLKLIVPISFSLPIYIIIFILIQILIVFPTFLNLEKIGKWKQFIRPSYGAYGIRKISWGSPNFFLQFSLGILYPLIFIEYFLLLKIFFIGKTINMNILFELKFEIIPFIILFVCYIPIFYWLLKKFAQIKTILWLNWVDNLTVLNLIVVQNDLCFNFLFHLNKLCYLIRYFPYYYHPVQHPNKLTISLLISKYLGKILDYSWIMTINLLVFPIIEILLTKQLYYFQYYLFFYILIKSLWYCIASFGSRTYAWAGDVTLSDYLYKNYKNPHFPKFYRYYYEHKPNEVIFPILGSGWGFTEEEQQEINEAYNKIKYKYYQTAGYRLTSERLLYIKKRFYKNSFLREGLHDFGRLTGRTYNFIYRKKIYKYK